MKTEQTAEWYDKLYQISIARKKSYSVNPEESHYYPLWMAVLSLINQDEWIADFGCGVGQFAQLAIGQGKGYLFGVDFSQVAIEEAKRRNPKKKDFFFIADITKPVSWNAYHVAVCLEVLEHIEGDIEFLKTIPQGKRVIFSVPSYDAQAHVRFFTDEAVVRERYEPLVEFESIVQISISSRNVIFLVNGRRRHED